MGLPLQISHEEFGIIWGSLFKLVLSNFGIIRMFWPYLPLYTILLSLSGHSFFPQRVYIDLSEIYSDIYRLLHGVFFIPALISARVDRISLSPKGEG